MKKTLQTGNVIALVVTIIINYLSNTGIFNGNTMASVSAEYENLFTPAGYAFSIWGLIYLSLLGFVIYQARSLFKKAKDDSVVLEIGWWFIISCIANSLWVVVWLYEYTVLSVIIMIVLLFSLLKIVVNARLELDDMPLKHIAFVWWPFSFYSGWVSVALIANIAAYLTKINWNGFGISEVTWTIIMIGIAGGINIFMTWNRNMREFALVGVWALVAIGVANWGEVPIIVQTSFAMAAVLFISSGIHGYKNRKTSPIAKMRKNK